MPFNSLGNQNKDKHSIEFYKHVWNSVTGKVLGLGKGDAKMVKCHHCPPESSHHPRDPGRKTTAKHDGFFFQRDELVVWVWTGREAERSVTRKGLRSQLQWSWPHHSKQGRWSRITRSSREMLMPSPHRDPDLLNQNLWGWVPVLTAVQEVLIGSKVWEAALLWHTDTCDVRGDDLPVVHWITHNF